MTLPNQSESHHGVLMNLSGEGVFFIGQAGIGKSSLALELLHQGHQLIADDIVEFCTNNDSTITGKCPTLLSGLLHCRELGLMTVQELFGPSSWQAQTNLKYVIHLQKDVVFTSTITPKNDTYTICNESFAKLVLDINTPASLSHRIMTWLTLQTTNNHAETTLLQRQKTQMLMS